MPYTGPHGELDFEADFIETLIHGGWEPEILYRKNEDELIRSLSGIVAHHENPAGCGCIPSSRACF